MNVAAFNSSPRKDRGGTALILAPFLDGMRSVGAEVELVHLHGLDIKPCLGCFACWLKTPGRCVQADAMESLLPKVAAADVTVYATPLYVDGMNSTLKAFLDRSIPLIEPWFEEREDHCRHPRRSDTRPGKVVLVSACGFTEPDNFDPLVVHMKAVCRNMDREFVGALLRPYASSLLEMQKMGVPVTDVLAAAEEAGRQLVEHGSIPADLLARVSRELVPRERYIRAVNEHFRRALRESDAVQQ
jgi:multimeric flavodoxin WrbA